jgi:diaminohydroxyphosphoribosylaminopyrimidine deaminase/5-amino-6-(5-phosphoribosylamino)uracil reductase
MVDGLRQEADVLVCRDGRVEEDIPGGHGVGVLQLPMVPANPGDLPTVLHALYQGGSRTVLIAGDTPLSRLLHDANLVNRIV